MLLAFLGLSLKKKTPFDVHLYLHDSLAILWQFIINCSRLSYFYRQKVSAFWRYVVCNGLSAKWKITPFANEERKNNDLFT